MRQESTCAPEALWLTSEVIWRHDDGFQEQTPGWKWDPPGRSGRRIVLSAFDFLLKFGLGRAGLSTAREIGYG